MNSASIAPVGDPRQTGHGADPEVLLVAHGDGEDVAEIAHHRRGVLGCGAACRRGAAQHLKR